MRQAGMVGKVCLTLLFAASLAYGQTSASSTAKTTTAKKTSSVSSRLAQMEKALDAQQQQIQQLQEQLKGRDSQVQQLQQQLTETQSTASQAQQAAQTAQAQASKSAPADQLDAVKKDVTDLQGTATSYALNLQETQKQAKAMLESPASLHFKGVTLTPGGFFAAESVYRNRGLAADINTPFNSVNMPLAGQNRVSEFYGSGRQSRISMLVEGKLSDELKYGGYYETDFLSAGVTSNNNQSNSYTLRQRQFWAQAAYKSWTFTGGQMWSLITETKKGMDNRSEAMPMTIDAQYTAGFSWARQYGFRVVDQLNKYAWLGFSVENPQTTLTARNNAGNFVLGDPGNSGGLYNGGQGANGSALANYSFNTSPDLVAKAVFEPGFGHYEIFGVFSRFRDRVYPCAEVFPGQQAFCTVNGVPGVAGVENATNVSRNGGGGGANARITLFKQLDIGAHGFFGNGIGRYGTTGLPDATVNADGTLALLRSYQALGTIEWHKPKFDIYLNGGGEYVARHFQTDPVTLKDVGYGAPSYDTLDCYKEPLPVGGTGFGFGSTSKCQANTRNILEGTAGFWYRIYNGPKGKLQFGPQYSYVVRNTWRGTGGTPHGIDNMVFTSFRYYLP